MKFLKVLHPFFFSLERFFLELEYFANFLNCLNSDHPLKFSRSVLVKTSRKKPFKLKILILEWFYALDITLDSRIISLFDPYTETNYRKNTETKLKNGTLKLCNVLSTLSQSIYSQEKNFLNKKLDIFQTC